MARERLGKKFTQSWLGSKFGITYQAVSQWETDEKRPDCDKMPDLAEHLKVPLIWLFRGTAAPPPPDAIEVSIERLSPAEIDGVKGLIQHYLNQREAAPGVPDVAKVVDNSGNAPATKRVRERSTSRVGKNRREAPN